MRDALIVHHDANSVAGLVGARLRATGWRLIEHTICPRPADPTSDAPLPGLEGIDLVVLLGSRWSVYDRARIGGWIDDEFDLVRNADANGVPVWGICFGAQVLAAALGGAVEASPEPEFGWCEVDSDEPAIGSGPWFQWHGDRVVIPPDAELLATAGQNPQAFRLRRNLATQFHPEVDRHVVETWLQVDRADLLDAGVDPDAVLDEVDRRLPEVRPRAWRLTDWVITRLVGSV